MRFTANLRRAAKVGTHHWSEGMMLTCAIVALGLAKNEDVVGCRGGRMYNFAGRTEWDRGGC